MFTRNILTSNRIKKKMSVSIVGLERENFKLKNDINPIIKFTLQENVEKLSKEIKRKKREAENKEPDSAKEKNEIFKLNETNYETIQYILTKNKRTADELFIIQEFLFSFKFFKTLLNNNNKEKVLSSLSLCLKSEKKTKNIPIFRYGNKGSKVYIVLKGELSVLILKETKVEITFMRYFEYLILLKLIKEDELLKKTILSNTKISPKIDEVNFGKYFKKLENFVNKFRRGRRRTKRIK